MTFTDKSSLQWLRCQADLNSLVSLSSLPGLLNQCTWHGKELFSINWKAKYGPGRLNKHIESSAFTNSLILLICQRNRKGAWRHFWDIWKWVWDDTGILPKHLFTEFYIGFLHVGSWNRQGIFLCFIFHFGFKLTGASGWNYCKEALYLSLSQGG